MDLTLILALLAMGTFGGFSASAAAWCWSRSSR
jgi:hypothetical protein